MNNKRSAARHPGGYTLVELMLTASIAAILASMALPSLGGLILDTRRTAVANDLLGTLQLARSEAIKRGQRVVVCGVDDADGNGRLEGAELACAGKDWSKGWLSAAWSDDDHDGWVDPAELRADSLRYVVNGRSGVTVTSGNFTTTPPVRPAGTTVLEPFLSRSGNGTVTICDRRGSVAARAVIISPNGRSRITTRRSGGAAIVCPDA